MVIQLKNGKKLYPVCNWNDNQHKLYYWYNEAYLQDDYEELNRMDELLNVFNAGVQKDGLVYVEGAFLQPIREAIVMYDLCH